MSGMSGSELIDSDFPFDVPSPAAVEGKKQSSSKSNGDSDMTKQSFTTKRPSGIVLDGCLYLSHKQKVKGTTCRVIKPLKYLHADLC